MPKFRPIIMKPDQNFKNSISNHEIKKIDKMSEHGAVVFMM